MKVTFYFYQYKLSGEGFFFWIVVEAILILQRLIHYNNKMNYEV